MEAGRVLKADLEGDTVISIKAVATGIPGPAGYSLERVGSQLEFLLHIAWGYVPKHQATEFTVDDISHSVRRGHDRVPWIFCLSRISDQIVEFDIATRFANRITIFGCRFR